MWRILVLLTLAPAVAAADGLGHRDKVADAPPRPVIELYCTDSEGRRRELGEVICITASCQSWMARCDMSLNNVMWRKLQDGCPAAARGPLPRSTPTPASPRLPGGALPAKVRHG